jgi:hypothetical protein
VKDRLETMPNITPAALREGHQDNVGEGPPHLPHKEAAFCMPKRIQMFIQNKGQMAKY